MYLARFELNSEKWVQGCALFPGACSSGTDAWAERLNSIITLLSALPDLRISYRVQISPEGARRLIILSAPEQREADLRRFIGLFLRLEVLEDESVMIPSTRDEHDRALEDFDRYRALIAIPEYRSRTAWLAFDFRLAESLTHLATQAADLGYRFSYQANLEPLSAPLELARAAAHNLIRLESETGVPAALVAAQREIVQRLKSVTHVIDEVLAGDSTAAVAWLSASVKQLAEATPLRLAVPDFVFEIQGLEVSLLAARHRIGVEQLSTAELASAAVTREQWQKLLAWNPPPRFFEQRKARAAPNVTHPEALAQVALAGAPSPHTDSADYIFVSYKRQDVRRIVPIMKRISEWGYHIWYDKEIPGGAEWDALIEERVQHCKLFLLFVSPAAIGSRYVRREVKFADTLAKPVLSICLENAELNYGMKMLLNQYQMLWVDSPDFHKELERAIQYLRFL